MGSASKVGSSGAPACAASAPATLGPTRRDPGAPSMPLGTGRFRRATLESGWLVTPKWLNRGPRMKTSRSTLCALRPKRPTKPRS